MATEEASDAMDAPPEDFAVLHVGGSQILHVFDVSGKYRSRSSSSGAFGKFYVLYNPILSHRLKDRNK